MTFDRERESVFVCVCVCVCVCVTWGLSVWTADWMTLLAVELSVGCFNISASPMK